ncbi:hypothetical protein C5167_036675 [Papaver somniferum]|uniref:Uncharacterized protein n=1 Tax=Papaver somniferum TaxID=3469 RepID=A0A4Y7I7R4_PAPSO|nr:hypothetical protein C5167_036675 [Papaver somniferum]
MESLTSRRRSQPTILFVLLLLTAFVLLIATNSTVIYQNNNICISRKLLQRVRAPLPNPPRPVFRIPLTPIPHLPPGQP